MRNRFPYTYYFLFFAFLALMSFPKDATERLRGTTIAFMAPSFHRILSISDVVSSWRQSKKTSSGMTEEEIKKLQLDNSILRNEITHLKEIVLNEMHLLKEITKDNPDVQQTADFIKIRRRQELQKLLQLQAIPARIIFRSPALWNSSLWIDVGQEKNDLLKRVVIAKNSPVLVGNSVIGVIDYVGKKQSRVLLITDSSLTPSVRALRSDSQALLIDEKIQGVLRLFENETRFSSEQLEQKELITSLQSTLHSDISSHPSLYLAKGEINGSGKPLWRSNRHMLVGTGFNYDYADGEGPVRDLRTGKEVNNSEDNSTLPIVKAGDLLVTTGMDGVFPPNLLVGEVIKVHMLKEGDYYYELDARPTVGNFDDISTVFVLPPVGYDPYE